MRAVATLVSRHPGLRLWGLLGHVLAPGLPVLLRRRLARGKEDPERWREKLGHASLQRPDGPLVWIHAASVGEFNSALPLIRRLAALDLNILATTGTVTSARIAATRLPAGASHQFAPLDAAPALSRFLDHWRPGLALFIESEIWPGQVAALAARDIPQVVVNGSLSQNAERSWARLPAFAEAVFSRLDLVLAQTELDADRFRRLGATQVKVLGNIKFDGTPLSAEASELARLRTAMANRPVWLAASTHAGEEAIVADAHTRLAVACPDLLTIIVPRHPERGEAIARELATAGLSVARRSLGEMPSPDCKVYLADTLSELGLFYRLAPISLVGGSFGDLGGHNPIEPVQLGSAVLVGPSTPDFAEIYAEFEATGGAIRVRDAVDLAGHVASLLADPAAMARQIAAASGVVASGTGALERTLGELAPAIGDLRPQPGRTGEA